MENESLKIVKRGDVYLMTMLAGENRFNKVFLGHLAEAFDFLEKYACFWHFLALFLIRNISLQLL